mgnify:CR=1 FL=1
MGKKDTVNKEERIGNLTLYGQTVSFGFTRMWLYVKGTLFFTVILILFILIDHLIGPKGNDIISLTGCVEAQKLHMIKAISGDSKVTLIVTYGIKIRRAENIVNAHIEIVKDI